MTPSPQRARTPFPRLSEHQSCVPDGAGPARIANAFTPDFVPGIMPEIAPEIATEIALGIALGIKLVVRHAASPNEW